MSTEKNLELMREFVDSIEEEDIEETLSFCTEDIRFVTPFGTFEGKEEVRRLLKWLSGNLQDMEYTETGAGIFGEGDKAAYEHTLTGKYDGEEIEVLMICTYQFNNGKIKELHYTMDTLELAKQATEGFLSERMVGTIYKQTRKGLD